MSNHALKATIRSFLLATYRLKFKVGAVVMPRRAAASGASLFCSPTRPSQTRLYPSLDTPAPAIREAPLASGPVTLYEWGNPSTQPTIVLVHGWNGWGLQFASFVSPLLQNGFAVVALDHRGHGRSDGDRASLAGFIDTAQELLGLLPKAAGIVAHSMGAAAAACALAQTRTGGLPLVLIAPPNDPRVFLEQFAVTFGIPDTLVDAMQQWVERRFGRKFSEVSIGHFAPDLRASTLVIHDPADNVVPFTHGESYATLVNGARLIPLEGWGHFKILQSPAAIRIAVDFVSGRGPGSIA